jgi:hypothetical protein
LHRGWFQRRACEERASTLRLRASRMRAETRRGRALRRDATCRSEAFRGAWTPAWRARRSPAKAPRIASPSRFARLLRRARTSQPAASADVFSFGRAGRERHARCTLLHAAFAAPLDARPGGLSHDALTLPQKGRARGEDEAAVADRSPSSRRAKGRPGDDIDRCRERCLRRRAPPQPTSRDRRRRHGAGRWSALSTSKGRRSRAGAATPRTSTAACARPTGVRRDGCAS